MSEGNILEKAILSLLSSFFGPIPPPGGGGGGYETTALKRGLLPCNIPSTESGILGSVQDIEKRFLGGFLLRTRKKGHTASELGFTT
jgi:hypothetical protein